MPRHYFITNGPNGDMFGTSNRKFHPSNKDIVNLLLHTKHTNERTTVELVLQENDDPNGPKLECKARVLGASREVGKKIKFDIYCYLLIDDNLYSGSYNSAKRRGMLYLIG